MHGCSTVAGLFAYRFLLWLRKRGFDVIVFVAEEEEGLLGVAARRSELSDLRIRWYTFFIESSRTPESLLRFFPDNFFTGATIKK